jgi:hypothetical protein
MDSGSIFRFPVLPPPGLSPFLGKKSPSGSSRWIRRIYQKKIRSDKLLDPNPAPPAGPEAGKKFGTRELEGPIMSGKSIFLPPLNFFTASRQKRGHDWK